MYRTDAGPKVHGSASPYRRRDLKSPNTRLALVILALAAPMPMAAQGSDLAFAPDVPAVAEGSALLTGSPSHPDEWAFQKAADGCFGGAASIEQIEASHSLKFVHKKKRHVRRPPHKPG